VRTLWHLALAIERVNSFCRSRVFVSRQLTGRCRVRKHLERREADMA
jgi:hypothetical protein